MTESGTQEQGRKTVKAFLVPAQEDLSPRGSNKLSPLSSNFLQGVGNCNL
jgi:hypothetical protein